MVSNHCCNTTVGTVSQAASAVRYSSGRISACRRTARGEGDTGHRAINGDHAKTVGGAKGVGHVDDLNVRRRPMRGGFYRPK